MAQRRTAPTRSVSDPCDGRAHRGIKRSGLITFWAIVSIPIFLIVLCIVLEIGNLWLARIQLKNALEAGALAAVKNWGDAGGGDTLTSRQVGNQFTSASMINGSAVDLSSVDMALNYDNAPPSNNQNGTISSTGVFVFGALTANNPAFVFDACATPNCTRGLILFDATGGNLSTGNNHEWGIRFRPDATLPAGLRITRTEIRLSGGLTFTPGTVAFADLIAPFQVVDNSANSAPDRFGLTPATQITPTLLVGNTVLRFDYNAVMGDDGFREGDRFRFGAAVVNGMANQDGDAIGGATVFVQFSNGTTATGTMVDTMFGGQFGPPPPGATCANLGTIDAVHNSLAVFPLPTLIPDLPCPPAAAAGNDNQSFVEIGNTTGTTNSYAVRAQVTYDVPSICQNVFGITIGPFPVTATVDAFYDCNTVAPRLYHVDDVNFTGVLPCPP